MSRGAVGVELQVVGFGWKNKLQHFLDTPPRLSESPMCPPGTDGYARPFHSVVNRQQIVRPDRIINFIKRLWISRTQRENVDHFQATVPQHFRSFLAARDGWIELVFIC